MSERSLFIRALEIDDPAQRSILLNRECRDDADLRNRIERLLSAHAAAGGILDHPPSAVLPSPFGRGAGGEGGVDTDLFRPIAEGPGTQIGPYKLREQIGEGGFGVVYVAEQERPVRRKVALKIIKPGMDTKDVIARFEAERQALALMDHPNVARVLDAGATDSGRPYFVMELVHGLPITDFCDKNKLPTRERLFLFADVCRAVQHAHQKGIIHRDLKPSNIMVTLHDGKPVAKVIDFGVSKALSQQLTEKSIYTAYGQMIGTPSYMSPEQAEMSGLGIDTRSDIYSLGVLLYELLTGKTPLDAKRLREGGYDAMLRMIRDEEPPRPSLKISTLGDEATAIALHRHTDPHQLRRSLSGELDWIVMKCLEKDRARRYETANNLARDVERYLQDEQVEACPPSLQYRASKYLRKNRAVVITTLAIIAGSIAALVGQTANVIKAHRAEARADREREAARSSEERAVANEKAAREAQQAAEQEKNNALAAKEELSHTIYALDMAQVQAAGESRQFARVAQLLELQRPAAGKPDPRGFEWHYWQRRLQRGRLRSVEVPQLASKSRVRSNTRVFSRNGSRLTAVIDDPADSTSRTAFGGLVAMFDGVTGRELVAPFDPFPDQLHTGVTRRRFVTMSDDGTRFAAALGKPLGQSSAAEVAGRLSIRDGDTGTEIRSIGVPLGVTEIALTVDGRRIAVEYVELTQSEDPRLRPSPGLASVKVWDTSTGELVQTLPMLPWSAGYGRILWSPDGARLLRQSVTMEIVDNKPTFQELFQVVDVASGEELWERKFPRHATARRPWSWSPDGKLVVIFELAEARIAAKNNAQLWDSYTGKTLAVLDREAPSNSALNATIDFSPDSQRLALATTANEIYVWELTELKFVSDAAPLHIAAPHLTLETAGNAIQAISFSEDARELVSVDTGTPIVTWDATTREETGVGPDGLPDYFLAAISTDATKVAFSGGGIRNPMSCVWDLAKNQEVFRSQTVGSSFSRPGFSADGRRVALVQPPGTPEGISEIKVYDTQTGEGLSAIPLEQTGPSFGMAVADPVFRPDGGQIAALIRPAQSSQQNPIPARLMAWDVATGKPVFPVTTVNAIFAGWLVYSLDGKSLVLGITGQPDSAAVFYDAATGERQRSVPMPSSPNMGVYIDIRHQIFASFQGSDALFSDLATGQERLRLRGYADIEDCAVSPDGTRIAVGKPPLISGGESEVTLWSLKTGRQLLTLKRQGTVERLSFSPDGNRLIAVCQRTGSIPLKPIQIYDATPLTDEVSK